jgi:hypothetical protein
MPPTWNNGTLEYWKPGTRALVPRIAGEGMGLSTAKRVQRILGVKTEGDNSIVKNSFKPIIPLLHYSNIPNAFYQ